MAEAKQVPALALRFGNVECEFGDNGENAKSAPISITARSDKPIDHWYWGRVVHDLKGMKLHKDRVVVDYCHYDTDVIGYLNHFDVTENGLECSGALTPFKDSDRATEIIHKAKAGVPWEASINFGGDGIVIEEVADGAEVEVNGYTLAGPATVIRQWPLRGVAVCPYGADMNTSSEFARDHDRKVAVTVLSQEKDMDDKTAKLAEVEDQTVEAEDKEKAVEGEVKTPVEAETVEAVDEPAVETDEQSDSTDEAGDADESTKDDDAEEPKPEVELTDGQRFLKAFGPQGGVWFAEGKTFEEAQELHTAAQSAEVERLTLENASLRSAQADARGEDPVTFQAEGEKVVDDDKTKRLKQNLGDELGGYAAGLKLKKADAPQ